MRGKKVFVAGGSGLAGMNLTERLVKEGAHVQASYHSRKPSIAGEVYRRFDFTNFDDCLAATKSQDCVFLCAAQIFGAKFLKERPTAFILPNLQINAGLLEACSRNGVSQVVLISSSTVYQEAYYPIAENQLDFNQPPFGPYFGVGWFNRYLEQLAALYHQRHGMKISIVRPTNLYGPHDSFDDDKSHVIPALIKRVLKKENPFIVWGTGNEVRNFLYVDDFVDDLLAIAVSPRSMDPINLGGEANLTIHDAVQVILEAASHRVTPQFDLSKPTAVPYRTVNCAKAAALLGNRPRTSFAQGISKTIEWYRATQKQAH